MAAARNVNYNESDSPGIGRFFFLSDIFARKMENFACCSCIRKKFSWLVQTEASDLFCLEMEVVSEEMQPP